MSTAKLLLNGHDHELPLVVGTENETGVDIQKLRSESHAITLDPGYVNTGSCNSAITFIDGERGILRYRGYPIEQIAENAVRRGLLPADLRPLPTQDELTSSTRS